MLLSGEASLRLEPVTEVRHALRDSPLLHGRCNGGRNAWIELLPEANGFDKLRVHFLRSLSRSCLAPKVWLPKYEEMGLGSACIAGTFGTTGSRVAIARIAARRGVSVADIVMAVGVLRELHKMHNFKNVLSFFQAAIIRNLLKTAKIAEYWHQEGYPVTKNGEGRRPAP